MRLKRRKESLDTAPKQNKSKDDVFNEDIFHYRLIQRNTTLAAQKVKNVQPDR